MTQPTAAIKDWDDALRAGFSPRRFADEEWGTHRTPLNDKSLDPPAAPSSRMILTSAEFIAGFVPPDYAIDGIAQRRFIYSFTGQTGAGKTAILLLLAYCVATGTAVAGREIARGRVLYCAGENPTDARMRWIVMADKLGFDINKIDVHWIDGVFNIANLLDRVAAEVSALGRIDLVIVDTSAAFFPGDEENNNVQMGSHARTLRRLTSVQGGPCVIVACHPVKNAVKENLLPRGGGAFLAEIDGNFTAAEHEGVVEFHWQGKLRGPDFAPISFQLLKGVTGERLKDSKGRLIQTVIARALSADEKMLVEKAAIRDEDAVIISMAKHPAASLAALADNLGWRLRSGEADKTKVLRIVRRLKTEHFTQQSRGKWTLTEKGEKEAEKVQRDVDLAGSRY